MRLDDFETLLALHGADDAGWPANERASVNVLLRDSADARALLEQYRAMDAVLAHVQMPEPDALFVDRIVASARGLRQEKPSVRGGSSLAEDLMAYINERVWRWVGVGLAASLAIGLYTGVQSVEMTKTQQTAAGDLKGWYVAASDPGNLW